MDKKSRSLFVNVFLLYHGRCIMSSLETRACNPTCEAPTECTTLKFIFSTFPERDQAVDNLANNKSDSCSSFNFFSTFLTCSLLLLELCLNTNELSITFSSSTSNKIKHYLYWFDYCLIIFEFKKFD
jgi:hypothetical protein